MLVAALAFAAALAGSYGDNPVYAQTPVDDDDDDGLIDVRSLAQLDAIRHDLNGADAATTEYNAAFPNLVTTSSGRMDCPSGTCTGYELRAHLDFDTDGATYTGMGAAAASDSGDAYRNGGAGFAPIGGNANAAARFNTTFNGNGYTISNLLIKRATTDSVGLFGTINATARIESVGRPP